MPTPRRSLPAPRDELVPDPATVSLGSGVSLVEEDHYIRALAPFGIGTRRAFRSLCRAIHCPLLICGQHGRRAGAARSQATALVDPFVFQLCIRALVMPGRPDFRLQWSSSRRRSRSDIRHLQADWSAIARSIVDSRRAHGLSTGRELQASIRDAGFRLSVALSRSIPRAPPPAPRKDTHASS